MRDVDLDVDVAPSPVAVIRPKWLENHRSFVFVCLFARDAFEPVRFSTPRTRPPTIGRLAGLSGRSAGQPHPSHEHTLRTPRAAESHGAYQAGWGFMTGGRDEYAELLQRAGLEIVGARRTEEVLPPQAAWRPVIAYEAEPTVAVKSDRPDLVAELNAQWHRLAVKDGIIGEDGVFLIDVADHWAGCAPRQWTRVRLTDH